MQHNNLPKISVVLPVRNNVGTIEKAIRSVIDQDYPNTELIVIDGGSSDGTVDIIKRYEAKISYWHSQPDGGCGNAINLGIQRATGDLVAQLMADDWFEPGIFQAIGKASLANPDIDIISCYGRIVFYDKQTDQYKPIATFTTPAQLELSVYNMCFGMPVMSCRFIKKTVYEKIGLFHAFDVNGKHMYCADREMLLRAAIHNCTNVTIPQLGHSYFAHTGSATFGNNRAIQMKIYQDHLETVDRYFHIYDITAPHAEILQRWYNHQSVRYVLYSLFAGQFANAWQTTMSGMAKSRIRWMMMMAYAPLQITGKKMLSTIRKVRI